MSTLNPAGECAWSEHLVWYRPAQHMPDTDETVLLALAEGGMPFEAYRDEPMLLGSWDGERWMSADGSDIFRSVRAWAALPVGPHE